MNIYAATFFQKWPQFQNDCNHCGQIILLLTEFQCNACSLILLLTHCFSRGDSTMKQSDYRSHTYECFETVLTLRRTHYNIIIKFKGKLLCVWCSIPEGNKKLKTVKWSKSPWCLREERHVCINEVLLLRGRKGLWHVRLLWKAAHRLSVSFLKVT
jgi:hypothetical protein